MEISCCPDFNLRCGVFSEVLDDVREDRWLWHFPVSQRTRSRILDVNTPNLREAILQGETAESAVVSTNNPDIIGMVDDMMGSSVCKGVYMKLRVQRGHDPYNHVGDWSRRVQSFLNALSVKKATTIATNEAVGVCFTSE